MLVTSNLLGYTKLYIVSLVGTFGKQIMDQELETLAYYLAGEFDNQVQSASDPTWYAAIKLWHIRINLGGNDPVFFAEQASLTSLDQPYRQRVFHLIKHPDHIIVQYSMIKNFMSWRGAGKQPEMLSDLTFDDLELLPGCVLSISGNSDRFYAQSLNKQPCTFGYDGKTYQVSLGFEVTANEFYSYDKGIDPITLQARWGAIMGPYRFVRTAFK